MSDHLDFSLPLQKSAGITKHLRSRDVPLRALLPFASAISDPRRLGKEIICFPQKEDWLLEWLVQRLREDNVEARDARCDSECWGFLLRLLLSSNSAGLILKKHNFLQLISKTFSEAVVPPAGISLIFLDGKPEAVREDIHTTLGGVVSSPSSSSTEQGLLRAQRSLKLKELLRSVGAVMFYLQGNTGVESGEGNVVAVLRGAPELAGQILGSYLKVCHILIQNGLELDEDWTNAVVGIWRSCVWGNPNSQKLSMIFSTFCLVPAAQLLAAPLTPLHIRSSMEQLVSEFIFSHEILASISGTKPTKPSAKDLKSLLEPLRNKRQGLLHLFEVGITSHTNKSKPDSNIVEVIFESIVSGALGIGLPVVSMGNSDAEIVMKLLDVLIITGTMVSSETLASLVDGISNLSHSSGDMVRWHMVEVALKLDFDIFLGKGNEARASKLINTITGNHQDEEIVFRVVELLIDGFVKTRDLERFVKSWILELKKEEASGGVWESDRVAKFFADRMEKSLLPGQINTILRTAWQEESWTVIDAILRGVQREDTEDKIRGLLSRVSGRVLKGKVGWRGWRSLVRALQIDQGLVKTMHGEILNEMKGSAAGHTEGDARKTLFASEVLMGCSEINIQEQVLIVASKAMKTAHKGWDGSIDHVNRENLGVVIVTGVVGKWLGTVELASPDVRRGFVDEFLGMAMKDITEDREKSITGRIIWQRMLAQGLVFEYPATKDAVFAALIAKLEPFSGMSRDMRSSLTNIKKGQGISSSQYEVEDYQFLLESITKYPLEAVKRTTRERILDTLVLLDAAFGLERVYVPVRGQVKILVERLWTLGNASSFLAKDVRGFMDWALGGGEKTSGRILRYVFATKEQERSRDFLKNVVELAERELLHMDQVSLGVVKVCEVIVEEFWRVGEGGTVKRLRKGVLKKLYELFQAKEMDEDLVGVWRRMWVLDQDLNSRKEALKLAQSLTGNIKPTLLKVTEHTGNDTNLKVETKAATETAILLCSCSKTVEEVVNTTALVIGMLDSPFAELYKPDILVAYRDMVSNNMAPDVFSECLERVVEGCFALRSDEVVQPGYWETLKILINGAKKPEEDEPLKNMIVHLSTVFSRMAQSLPKSKTIVEFLALIDCMNVILLEKTWAVMQYNIDETLASVTITSSPSGPQFSPTTAAADEIFLRLCELLRLVLSLHRRRVRGGRYHLVIAALQSLLHCMYKRKAPEERKKSDRVVHPPWLLNTASYCSRRKVTAPFAIPAITEKCVESFDRLVITLCEPSASSVRNKTRKTDDSLVYSFRDYEKREVACCINSLLSEILKGNLDGGLECDITISISAIFELLGAEGVKAFARTVDREGRAMLRGLWDEYNRVGRGMNEKL